MVIATDAQLASESQGVVVASNLPASASSSDHTPSEPSISTSPPSAGLAATTQLRDWRFWILFVSIGLATLLTPLELSGVSTALPVITHDLGGTTFLWVASTYALAATAFTPLSGGIAQTFGRKPSILAALVVVAAGSAVCGAASSMNMLTAGRVIQGAGGGTVASLCYIIVADLVPLQERGLFNSYLSIAWAVGSGTGPILGGALAQSGTWRWLFYLNIPICGVVALLITMYLRLPSPQGSALDKLRRMDWIGNLIIIAAPTSVIIALTWSGVQYPWGSVQVLVPLVVGLVGMVGFFFYEARYAKHPIAPFVLMSTRTGLSGYVQTFLVSFLWIGLIYYMPVYFQACKGATPVLSGVYTLSATLVTPATAMITGLSIKKSGRYRPQIWLGWFLMTLGIGVLHVLHADTPLAYSIGLRVVGCVGNGILIAATVFPSIAPLNRSLNAQAMAYFSFLRNFGQVWGVSVGGAILQQELLKRIPAAVLKDVSGSTAVTYAIIPVLNQLQEPVKSQVREAFAQSLQVVWSVFTAISGLGLLVSLGMKHLSLSESPAAAPERKEDEGIIAEEAPERSTRHTVNV